MSSRDSDLIRIGAQRTPSAAGGSTRTISRRSFLKVLGASSAGVGLAGCADDATQNILPFVKGEVEQIPGVAEWFSSTCVECSAGCGIQVRTREGRAVKIEGNADHPINRGGLCALGQAALQSLYDPDRVRQPLRRTRLEGGRPIFEPISWEEAYQTVAEALRANPGSGSLLCAEQSGAMQELIRLFCAGHKADLAVFDPLQPVALARAAELVLGTYGLPRFRIDKAEVVLNLGTEMLETWVSPVEFARDWARGRKSDRPMMMATFEPRLSLTGANSDVWHLMKPGSELRVAQYLLKLALDSGRGRQLTAEILEGLRQIVQDLKLETVAAETGIPAAKLQKIGAQLLAARTSLVMAGGISGATQEQLAVLVVVSFLNVVLGNVGVTVQIDQIRKPASSLVALQSLIRELQDGKVKLLMVHGTNPAYSLPPSFGFQEAVSRVPLVVSFSSHLDETAQAAHLVLPAHTSLESWGDTETRDGLYSLMQPVMQPVFDTRNLGDMLLEISRRAGKPIEAKGQPGIGVPDFLSFLKMRWATLHMNSGILPGSFERFWETCLEQGGYFPQAENDASTPVRVRPRRESLQLDWKSPQFMDSGEAGQELVLLPFASVKSFDGRAANRPWLQELPDPISSVVWDSWAEVHPETARAIGVARDDVVVVSNHNGQVQVPVVLTPYVHPGAIAIPLGQGHKAYGRYASDLGVNPLSLLPGVVQRGTAGLAFVSARVAVRRGRGRADLVVTQGSDSQQGRDLARSFVVPGQTTGAAPAAEHPAKHEQHQVKQMYQQREHPLYEWGMVVDLSSCIGCSACVVACYAENNIPVVGKGSCSRGREMSWLRIERFHDGNAEDLQVNFLPIMCQQCHNAPCEPVCPVYATYHSEEGLNVMVYNRCVGTRYCSNNCPYKVRRFNWHEYEIPEPLTWQLNPDVVKRSMGVMEQCTFCIQRITEGKDRAKDLGRPVQDREVLPACVQSCPTQALTFGNLKDQASRVSRLGRSEHAYRVLDHHINTQPAVTYLERARYKMDGA